MEKGGWTRVGISGWRRMGNSRWRRFGLDLREGANKVHVVLGGLNSLPPSCSNVKCETLMQLKEMPIIKFWHFFRILTGSIILHTSNYGILQGVTEHLQ